MPSMKLSQVLANIARTETGLLQGQIAAEQEKRRRLLEQRQQEEAYDKQIFANLNRLAPDSQAGVTEWLFRRAQNRAQGRTSDFGMETTAQPGPSGPFRPGPAAPSLTPVDAAITQPTTPRPGRVAPLAAGATSSAPVASPFALAELVDRLPAPTTPYSAPPPEMQERPQTVVARTIPAPAAAPAPTAPRPTAPPPRKRPSIQIAGYGTAFLAGVDPKRAAALQTRVDRRLAELKGYNVDDPAAEQRLAGVLQLAPQQIESEEDMTSAVEFLRQSTGLLPGLAAGSQRLRETKRQNDIKAYRTRMGELGDIDPSSRAAELPDLLGLEDAIRTASPEGAAPIAARLGTHRADIARIRELTEAGQTQEAQDQTARVWGRIQKRLTPQMEARKEAALQRTLRDWDLKRSVNPAAVRKAYADAGLGYKSETMSDDELVAVGRGRAEEAYQRMLGSISRVAGLSPASQKAYLENLSRMALYAGRPNLVPPTLERSLPPGFREHARERNERFQYQKQRNQERDQQREEDRQYRRQRDVARDAAKAAGKKSSAVTKYASPQERSEYNALNGAAWGPERNVDELIYDESKMSKAFLEQRRAARARQNALVDAWKQRAAAAEGKQSGSTADLMRDLAAGKHLASPGGRAHGAPVPLLPPATGAGIAPPKPGPGKPPPGLKAKAKAAPVRPAPAKKAPDFDRMTPAQLKAWFRKRQGG